VRRTRSEPLSRPGPNGRLQCEARPKSGHTYHPQVIAGCVTVRRQKQNHRLLWVQIRFTHSRAVGPENEMIEIQPERTLNFRIE
jgi:hypothetical protein